MASIRSSLEAKSCTVMLALTVTVVRGTVVTMTVTVVRVTVVTMTVQQVNDMSTIQTVLPAPDLSDGDVDPVLGPEVGVLRHQLVDVPPQDPGHVTRGREHPGEELPEGS